MTITNDLECLDQRDTCGQHRGELPAENRDIARRDLAATCKQTPSLLSNTGRNDTLTP
jgi:hypothetical protein